MLEERQNIINIYDHHKNEVNNFFNKVYIVNIKINVSIFWAIAMSVLLDGCTNWILTKCLENARREQHENAIGCFEQILKVVSNKTATGRPLNSNLTDLST